METFLPPTQAPQVNSLKRYFGILTILLLGYQVTFGQDVDLTISNLTLTAADETNFVYSFSLTNSGTNDLQGYTMRLKLSHDDILDDGDFFILDVPSSNVAAQYIGPNQTLLKSEHFYAATSGEYLPSGTWYIFAEINFDHSDVETNYTNNIVVSTNTISVAPYQLTFITPPVVNDITDGSFTLHTTFDPHITRIYYLYQADGLPAPDESTMQSSQALFSWQPDIVLSGLGPAFGYDVYCLGESYDGNVTAVYQIDVTTTGNPDPTIVLSTQNLGLDPTGLNQPSQAKLISIAGYHLTSNVVVTPSSNFVVSRDDIAYADQVTFLPTDFDDAATQYLFVKTVSIGGTGTSTGTLTCTSTGAVDKIVDVSVLIYDPEETDFNGLTTLGQSGWTAYSVTGDQTWTLIDLDETALDQRTKGNDKAILIDGTENSTAANEDWLISPAMDLSSYKYNPTVKFRSYSSGAGEPLVLKYSADYPGFGDPTNATWFDTEAEFAAVNSAEWKSTELELTNRETSIHFAFVYTSTETVGSRWTVDDWKVSDNLVNIPTNLLVYQGVPAGTFSASQSMDINIAGYGDVTVSASTGFQVSTDNVAFSASVTIPEGEASAGTTIYIRFTPVGETDNFPGTLTFTANEFSVTRNALVGSSSITTAAEKSITNSGFIYPNPTEGTVHIDLKTFDNASPIVPVSVSSSMGATISYFESSVSGLDSKLTDVVTNLAPGIYYITVKSKGTTYRNKLVRK